MHDAQKVGTTLSQIGLSIRIDRSVSWIRKQGDVVEGCVSVTSPETWARIEYADRRCTGYRRVA
jgi:hypothetical protein